ncbi:unnamed protein product [Porites lobata]|uniref:Uncharacterized protein n=1 Tax=Porites lobata TaxID=104759 RepID=A0ABN8Q4E8_9CNID|nr:unnamed protein product [Porites lobata]
MAIYSLLQRRDVMEILSTRFGKSMIFTVFAMAKEEISSSKTCMITISPLKRTIDDQISEMLSLCCKAMDLMTETKDAQRNSPYFFSIFFFAWCSLSYNSNLKIALYVKIQHPANNTYKAGSSIQTFTDKAVTETTNQGSLVCSCPDPGILVGKDQRN